MDIFPLPPETPMVLTPHTASTPTIQSFHEVTEARVGDELIGYCITPRKLTVVKNILQCEQHKYSLQLLPYIFTREMSSSNTEGTRKKLPLDTTKMNSLNVLVFNRFIVESHVEKDYDCYDSLSLLYFWFFLIIDVIKFLRPYNLISSFWFSLLGGQDYFTKTYLRKNESPVEFCLRDHANLF